MTSPTRLAIIVSHPIQYYSRWFAYLEKHLQVSIRVFYLWNFGVTAQYDPGFEQSLRWDIDLLEGYDHQFVENEAHSPGTHHFGGLKNPSLIQKLLEWQPTALLLFGYRYWTHVQVITSRKLRKIPFIFRGDSHLLGEKRTLFYRWSKELLLPTIYRRFSAFLSVGQANADYFLKYGVPPARLFHAPHSIDNDRFFAAEGQTCLAANFWRKELRIPEHHRVILFAGKFEEKKRPVDLLQAFIAARLPHTTLLLVGGGPLAGKLSRLAESHPDVRLVPFQNQSVMPQVYAAADLLVLPSVGPGETWGLVVNEASCLRKPSVVSSHVGCQADLVEPGRNGWVFPAGNSRALSDTLIEALSDSARLKRWGEESRQLVENFSFRETTAGLQRALEAIAVSNQPA